MDPKRGSPERRAMTEMSNENISKKYTIEGKRMSAPM